MKTYKAFQHSTVKYCVIVYWKLSEVSNFLKPHLLLLVCFSLWDLHSLSLK